MVKGNDLATSNGIEPEHLRKLFVGGLHHYVTDEKLKSYFEKWGDIVDVVVMKDRKSQRSRGFGFVTYSKVSMLDAAQEARPHALEGKVVETKRAVPREQAGTPESSTTVHRIFVAGIKDEITEEELKNYFSSYGTVLSVSLVTDKSSGKRKGFGFIEFDDYDSVDKVCLRNEHVLRGKLLDVKKALNKKELAKKAASGPYDGPEQGQNYGSGYNQNNWNIAGQPVPGTGMYGPNMGGQPGPQSYGYGMAWGDNTQWQPGPSPNMGYMPNAAGPQNMGPSGSNAMNTGVSYGPNMMDPASAHMMASGQGGTGSVMMRSGGPPMMMGPTGSGAPGPMMGQPGPGMAPQGSSNMGPGGPDMGMGSYVGQVQAVDPYTLGGGWDNSGSAQSVWNGSNNFGANYGQGYSGGPMKGSGSSVRQAPYDTGRSDPTANSNYGNAAYSGGYSTPIPAAMGATYGNIQGGVRKY